MIREVSMPALSSTMTEGKIVTWKKSVGDRVERGDILLVVESDKADMDVESLEEGNLANILVGDGNNAPVGSAIALIAETEAEIAQAKARTPQPAAPAATKSTPVEISEPSPSVPEAPANGHPPGPAPRDNGSSVAVSPNARRLARELGVDLAGISGSGPGGRIVGEDVQKAAVARKSVTEVPTAPSTPAALPVVLPEVAATFSTAQRAVIRNMEASLTIPVFHVGYTITTEALDSLAKQLKSKGVTMSVLLVKAVATVLTRHPLVYATYSPSGVRQNSEVNVAVAVAMEDGGLITPVLRQADSKDIYTLAREWKDLVERARTKKLLPEEYTTGNFTISNLGMFGVDRFDAVVPPGTSAILAIGAARPTVVATEEGYIAVKRQMQVNLSGDHRVFYGAHGAQFLQDLARVIESAQQLTL
ncbi:MAG: 2-oxo acid dehydrogenase subunit E2 [Gemmatimonadaceae bacterium]|nr:2-oxo acid dehydrogenase subunit E2 [Gloeobacterales cyanobacterium ES-bin-141]